MGVECRIVVVVYIYVLINTIMYTYNSYYTQKHTYKL